MQIAPQANPPARLKFDKSECGRYAKVRMAPTCAAMCLQGQCVQSSRMKLVLVVVSIALALVAYRAAAVGARYLRPTSNYRVAGQRDFKEADGPMPTLRRQDFDETNGGGSDGDDEDADEFGDHNAAASYKNQDDGGGGNQNAGQPNDGFDDNDPDGPYEETPVEKEGQADLERFFDDHLGASDRDGMDNENLPTNLIATLSEPPPSGGRSEGFGEARMVLRAAPPAPIEKPLVRSSPGRLVALPTIQTTSFIRLPDEKKLIVTNQITRNTIGAPIGYDRNDDKAAQAVERSRYGASEDHEFDLKPARSSSSSSSSSPLSAAQNDPTNIQLNIEVESPGDSARGEARRRDSLRAHPKADNNQAGQQDARADKMNATGSEVVITEDDDEDRVYVTNATNKPFKIDALGGYDPEADFRDAAKELDSAGGEPARHQNSASRTQSAEAGADSLDGGDEDPRESSDHTESQREQLVPARHELSFQEAPEDDMYEDASETDEVTFGQDDPYQTDLEAEMRLQDYDKVGRFMATGPARSGSGGGAAQGDAVDKSAESNQDTAGDSRDGADFNNDDGKVDPSDDDADIENDYKSRKPEVGPRAGRRSGEDLDEGNWVNDGADEMDVPSQSHQNFILDKAARHDAKVRKAAENELEAERQRQERQPPEGGQTASDEQEDESQRMPNADYMKNDLIEDDSGYAA